MGSITEGVKHLIIINVLFYIANWYFTKEGIFFFDAMALQFPENENFGIWQYFTYMFLHDPNSIMHILFNMYALFAFGSALESMWGRNKFFFFYMVTGIGAGLIYTLVNYVEFNDIYEALIAQHIDQNTIKELLETGKYIPAQIDMSDKKLGEFYNLYHGSAVGASGAIYGVLVAFGVLFPNAKLVFLFIPYPISAKYFVPLIIGVDIFFGLTSYSMGNIAHFAHIGGALTGFLIACYWEKRILFKSRY